MLEEGIGYNQNTLYKFPNNQQKINKIEKPNNRGIKEILLFKTQDPDYKMEIMMTSA